MRITSRKQIVTLSKDISSAGGLTNFRNEWYRKWNRILAIVVCMLGFVLVLAIVFANQSYVSCIHETAEVEEEKGYFVPPPYCVLTPASCTVTCQKVPDTENLQELVTHAVNEVEFRNKCSVISSLQISESTFPNLTISQGWMDIELSIAGIAIETCNFDTIEDGAFDSHSFHSATKLYLTNNAMLEDLTESMLSGLDSVDYLFVYCSNGGMRFHKKVLSPMKNTIATLQIQGCLTSSEAVRNLTYYFSMSKLQKIDFQYNTNLDSIGEYNFLGASNVLSLYLTGCSITSISVWAFVNMNSLLEVHLQGNALTTLPLAAFSNLTKMQGLFVYGNQWNCVCDLEWLKYYPYRADNPLCVTPSQGYFSDVDFCPAETTTVETTETATTELTTSTILETTITTTVQEFVTSTSTPAVTTAISTTTETVNVVNNTISILCINMGAYEEIPQEVSNASTKIIAFTTILIMNRTIFFQAEDYDDGNIRIRILGDTRNFHLIWIDSDWTKDRFGCYSNFLNVVPLPELEADTSYVVCMIYAESLTVSPLDCLAVKTQPSWENRAWITNAYQCAIYAGIVGGLVIALILGALILYLCVRRNPVLLKGSKRVVMVRHRTADAIILPKNYKEKKYVNPPVAIRDYEYMTPIIQKQANVRCRPLVRSNSDSSLRSTAASYIAAMEPSISQLLTWRNKHVKKRAQLSEVFDDPPPLPPHPKEKKYVNETGPPYVLSANALSTLSSSVFTPSPYPYREKAYIYEAGPSYLPSKFSAVSTSFS